MYYKIFSSSRMYILSAPYLRMGNSQAIQELFLRSMCPAHALVHTEASVRASYYRSLGVCTNSNPTNRQDKAGSADLSKNFNMGKTYYENPFKFEPMKTM